MKFLSTNNISSFIIRNGRILFWLSILITIFMAPLIPYIQKDFSYKAFYKDNDPYLSQFLEYEKSFGNDDKVVVIATNEKSFLHKDEITKIKTIHRSLQKTQHSVNVQSLFNFPYITEKDDEISISNHLELEPDEILNNPNINRFLISNNGKVIVFYISLKNYFSEVPNYSIPIDSAKQILEDLKLKDVTYSFTGTASLMDAAQKYTISDLKLLLPLVIIIIFLISYILFQNIIVSFLTLVLVLMTIIITLGLATLLNIQMSSTTALMPQIILSICILDAIHILSHYSLKNSTLGKSENHIQTTLKENLIPTFLTSFTTAIGFFSLCFSDLRPVQELGALCSIGVMLAWILSFAFLPYCIKKMPSRLNRFNPTLANFNSSNFVLFINKHKNKIIILSTILFLISLEIASRNIVDADTLNFFKKNSQVRTDYEYALNHIGGVKGIELLLTSDTNVLTSDNLAKIKFFEKQLLNLNYVTNVRSIQKELENIYRLIVPEKNGNLNGLSDADLKELVFTYELASSNDNSIWNWITNDYKKLKINVLWTLSGNLNSLNAIREIKKLGKRIGLKLKVTGKTSLVVGVNDYLVKTILSSIFFAIIALTLLMGYFAKSFRIGIATMIPNIFPVVIVAAIATLVGININMGSVLVASICLGIALDDTIHFCYQYYQLSKQYPDNEVKNITTIINTTGKSLIATTLILVSCFVIFIFSNIVINIEFGVLTTLILILALFCDFIILPAILLNKRPKKITTLLTSLATKKIW